MNKQQKKENICCSQFNPGPWQEQEVVWKNKHFVKEPVWAFLHIPLNMGAVMTHMQKEAGFADAAPEMQDWLVLSDDSSLWRSDQYMAVTKEVPSMENTFISGTFLTKVYEGPYKQVGDWHKDIAAYAKSRTGADPKKVYAYYTTCPKCAKKWGKNYVVMFAQVE